MFDKILFISDKGCNVKLKDKDNLAINLMNLHLIFEDDKKKILGEVDDLDGDIVRAGNDVTICIPTADNAASDGDVIACDAPEV